MDRKKLAWRVLQAVFVVAVLVYAGRLAYRHWQDVRALGSTLDVAWTPIAMSMLLVLLSYAVLIHTWRTMLAAWGEQLAALPAARIWFVSNLGRYLPGKVWQIGAMGTMAHGQGIAPEAAVGSSLVIALVNVLVGFGIVILTGPNAFGLVGVDPARTWIPLAAILVGILTLPWSLPPAVRQIATWTKRDLREARLPVKAVWTAAAGCAAAWLLYGLAFSLLSAGVLGSAATGGALPYVAVFTLSYLAGFLALFAPGGIGVREVAMGAMLTGLGLTTAAGATVLVVVSRLWLTLLEIIPGILFLAWRDSRQTALHPPST